MCGPLTTATLSLPSTIPGPRVSSFDVTSLQTSSRATTLTQPQPQPPPHKSPAAVPLLTTQRRAWHPRQHCRWGHRFGICFVLILRWHRKGQGGMCLFCNGSNGNQWPMFSRSLQSSPHHPPWRGYSRGTRRLCSSSWLPKQTTIRHVYQCEVAIYYFLTKESAKRWDDKMKRKEKEAHLFLPAGGVQRGLLQGVWEGSSVAWPQGMHQRRRHSQALAQWVCRRAVLGSWWLVVLNFEMY